MKIIAFADPHLCHKNPASRIDNYEDAAFGKLDQIATLAIKVGARAVVCSGDWFHLKTGTPHHIVVRLIEWARCLDAHSIMLIGIAGNHDLVANRLASLPQQPLGVLFASGLIYDAAFTVIDVNNEHLVGVTGLPYPDAADPDCLARVPENPCLHGIVLIHAFASPEGGDYFGEHIHAYTSFARLAKEWDVVVCGHDHRDQGVQRVDGKWIVNVGALLRGNIGKADLTRDIKVALLTFEDHAVTVQQVKLVVGKVEDVFDLEEHAKKVEDASKVEAFLAKLETDLDGRDGQPLMDRLAGLDIPEVVRTRVRTYLELAEQT